MAKGDETGVPPHPIPHPCRTLNRLITLRVGGRVVKTSGTEPDRWSEKLRPMIEGGGQRGQR